MGVLSIAHANRAPGAPLPAGVAGPTRVPAQPLPGRVLPPGLAGATPSPRARASVTPTPCARRYSELPAQDEAMERQILKLINLERTTRKLAPLMGSDSLTQAARRHSADMATNDFFDHISSDKSDYRARIDGTCYVWSTIGENIGGGTHGDAAKMVEGWMRSPPHRASILNPNYTEAGVGYATNAKSTFRHYWTVNFGAPLARQ
jgi:uncharacterized protein YkwD